MKSAIPNFLQVIDLGSDDSPWVRFSVCEALPEALRRIVTGQRPSPNLLIEAGRYRTNILNALAAFADIVVEAQELEDFVGKKRFGR